jgi:hypothetical protein
MMNAISNDDVTWVSLFAKFHHRLSVYPSQLTELLFFRRVLSLAWQTHIRPLNFRIEYCSNTKDAIMGRVRLMFCFASVLTLLAGCGSDSGKPTATSDNEKAISANGSSESKASRAVSPESSPTSSNQSTTPNVESSDSVAEPIKTASETPVQKAEATTWHG